MNDVLVPVIIKAPNQKIDDLLVKCNSNWTVLELKSHLSQVYPSKPHPKGQKLIYSGKLLLDNMVVTDVLKSYNGQQNNTIHLVCSLTRDNTYFETKPNVPEKKPVQDTTTRTQPSVNSESSSTPQSQTIKPELSNAERDYRQIYMERAYLINSYMQYIQQHINWSVTNNPPQFFINNEEPRENIRNNINNQLDNDENIGEEERQANRDWLDWVYILSRLIVLSTVVYFYSSPLRCIMVTAMALILYHLGMFRLRQLPINNIFNNFNNNNNIPNNNVNDDEQTDQQPENAPNNGEQTDAIERFSWIKTVIHFVISFLLSLVPDNRENN